MQGRLITQALKELKQLDGQGTPTQKSLPPSKVLNNRPVIKKTVYTKKGTLVVSTGTKGKPSIPSQTDALSKKTNNHPAVDANLVSLLEKIDGAFAGIKAQPHSEKALNKLKIICQALDNLRKQALAAGQWTEAQQRIFQQKMQEVYAAGKNMHPALGGNKNPTLLKPSKVLPETKTQLAPANTVQSNQSSTRPHNAKTSAGGPAIWEQVARQKEQATAVEKVFLADSELMAKLNNDPRIAHCLASVMVSPPLPGELGHAWRSRVLININSGLSQTQIRNLSQKLARISGETLSGKEIEEQILQPEKLIAFFGKFIVQYASSKTVDSLMPAQDSSTVMAKIKSLVDNSKNPTFFTTAALNVYHNLLSIKGLAAILKNSGYRVTIAGNTLNVDYSTPFARGSIGYNIKIKMTMHGDKIIILRTKAPKEVGYGIPTEKAQEVISLSNPGEGKRDRDLSEDLNSIATSVTHYAEQISNKNK